jgi:hypothetical protein
LLYFLSAEVDFTGGHMASHTATRVMLEAAHNAEIEHYARNHQGYYPMIGTPYPVLKVIIEAALKVQGQSPLDPCSYCGRPHDYSGGCGIGGCPLGNDL